LPVSCIPTAGHLSGLSRYYAPPLSAQTNRARFIPFASNFKNFKDAYFRVRHGDNGRELMYASDGSPLFPFYWTSNPSLVKVVDSGTLKEGDDVTLKCILRKMSRATDAQWKAHLTATRRQRAAVSQPNPAPANPAPVPEDRPAAKRGRVDT
ncbi:hypothetical protein A2U01_0033889, partial [Trifolium medium]|nr:hypothetical protein [Trifolium medium]